MTVRPKAIKPPQKHTNADEVINRGGRTVAESSTVDSDELRFTLRISNKIIRQIDKERSHRIGNVSRNQWIIEAIVGQLNDK